MEEQAKKVSLYLECSTTALGKKERMCGYVLEYITEKGPATLVNYREGCGTYNREFLLGLVEALERIKTPCELPHIRTEPLCPVYAPEQAGRLGGRRLYV